MAFCTSSCPATRPSRSFSIRSKILKRRIFPEPVGCGTCSVPKWSMTSLRYCAALRACRRGSCTKSFRYSSNERMVLLLAKSFETSEPMVCSVRLASTVISWPGRDCLRKRGASLVLLAAFLAGCPPTGSEPCQADADCGEGRSCRLGACAPEGRDDLDCPAGKVCGEGGRCAVPLQCRAASDCASGFTCVEGACRCLRDAACAAGEACLSGACAPMPACAQDAECAAY